MNVASAVAAPFDALSRSVVDVEAPPERLAMWRILVSAFVVVYLLVRAPVFLQLADREAGFDGQGLAAALSGPVPGVLVPFVLAITVVAGGATMLGWRVRATAPIFALGVLALTSYRSSWGQLLHFENLFTLHLMILALAPSADRWSLDARAGRADGQARGAVAYGWPLRLAGLVVVVTYVITGFAKLRYGGTDWIVGDTLRNHIAYSAARLDVLGGVPSPLAGPAVGLTWPWPFAAAMTVAIELSAPLVLFGGRLRTLWVAAAWLLHAGIFGLMLIVFPYPLFLVAFAPFFRLERIVHRR